MNQSEIDSDCFFPRAAVVLVFEYGADECAGWHGEFAGWRGDFVPKQFAGADATNFGEAAKFFGHSDIAAFDFDQNFMFEGDRNKSNLRRITGAHDQWVCDSIEWRARGNSGILYRCNGQNERDRGRLHLVRNDSEHAGAKRRSGCTDREAWACDRPPTSRCSGKDSRMRRSSAHFNHGFPSDLRFDERNLHRKNRWEYSNLLRICEPKR